MCVMRASARTNGKRVWCFVVFHVCVKYNCHHHHGHCGWLAGARDSRLYVRHKQIQHATITLDVFMLVSSSHYTQILETLHSHLRPAALLDLCGALSCELFGPTSLLASELSSLTATSFEDLPAL